MWGAGQTASLLLSEGLLRNRELVMVIDGNAAYDGHRLCDAPIVSPLREDAVTVLADTNIPILVASLREATDIETTIQDLGYMNPVVLPLPGTDSDMPTKTIRVDTTYNQGKY